MQNNVEHLANALESVDESPSSVPVQGQNQAPASLKSIAERFGDAKLHVIVQKVAYEEIERILWSTLKEALSKAVKKEVLYALHIGIKLENDGLKAARFHIVEQILVEMAQNIALEEVSEYNI